MPQVVLRAGGDIPPPLNQRYFTQLDGQSKYWRRIEPNYGQTVNATLECLFYGAGTGAQHLIGRPASPPTFSDKFSVELFGNQIVVKNGTLQHPLDVIDQSKINRVSMVADGSTVVVFINGVQKLSTAQNWSGLLNNVGFGRSDVGTGTAFYNGILVSSRVKTDTVDNVYGLDTNLAYDLPEGVTLGPELWINPVFSAPWIDNSGGSYSFSSASGVFSSLSVQAATQDDVVYVAFSAEVVSGALRVSIDGVNTVIQPATGVRQFKIRASASTTGTTQLSFLRNTGGVNNEFTVSDVSFKGTPNSALIFENGSIDGSDRLLVTKKQDGSGFVGETGINYDYATGANPETNTYSSEYSSEYA